MARSDGRYPEYKQLDVHPEKPPPGYWELGVRECISCKTHWPNLLMFVPSPCCHDDTLVRDDAPPPVWRNAIRDLLRAKFERYYEEWNEGSNFEESEIEIIFTPADELEPEESSCEL